MSLTADLRQHIKVERNRQKRMKLKIDHTSGMRVAANVSYKRFSSWGDTKEEKRAAMIAAVVPLIRSEGRKLRSVDYKEKRTIGGHAMPAIATIKTHFGTFGHFMNLVAKQERRERVRK